MREDENCVFFNKKCNLGLKSNFLIILVHTLATLLDTVLIYFFNTISQSVNHTTATHFSLGARLADLSVPLTADEQGFSHRHTPSLGKVPKKR